MEYDEKIHMQLKQVGLNIAYYRKLREMSQDELANKAKINRGTLSHLEIPTVYTNPTIETLIRIADALDIKPGLLLEFQDNI